MNTVRNIIIAAAGVLVLATGAFLFAAFALPQITGEPNKISEIVEPPADRNTPAEVIKDFETAFNNNDRDGMAKCFLPEQSLQRNTQGGGVQVINRILGSVNSDAQLHADFELTELNKSSEDAVTATGTVRISVELPIVGEQGSSVSVSFAKEDYQWYIKDFEV